ncbi:SDR family NAD(P)-dependent oxidoreductase [Pseudofrankia inefficax]|uniref:Short-chain dehydrogenase/reductase SDR n=1 Tax=Pseudofrankia inefficax (strain DSM 45817 / CECT 9037 / DDB 130130 / EuI1c) TaxID=298654 RepID=E3IVA2_PSEI1|nr:SDR family oxidoreductase [Pseudofrankia inefficax]ADP81266.1 short-chain dehydrogenase/reductase SDR [Pseudofrankia inefficax]
MVEAELPSIEDFSGLHAVVTGGGTGIGRSIALSLAEAGAAVAVADIEPDVANAVRDEIVDKGGRAIAVQVDVSKHDAVVALADRVFDEFGTVEILVNNAGVTVRPFRALWESSISDFEWVMACNFWGVLYGIRAFLPRMLEQSGFRQILCTSSTSSLTGLGGHTAYTASKGAVDGLVRSLTAEVRPAGIGVTTLFPGPVETRIWSSERLRSEQEKSDLRDVPAYVGPDRPHKPVKIGADRVGPMVVEALRQRAPYVLTHEEPMPNTIAYLDSLGTYAGIPGA